MRGFIWLLGIVTVVSGLMVLFGAVSDRLEAFTLPFCGIGLVSGILYLLLAARQSRVDREAREDARARKLAADIVRQQRGQ